MCDSFIVLADATLNGDVIFGKNSDRPMGEIQDLVSFPGRDYKPGTGLTCTYVTIPQVRHTFAVILSKPRWIWGAEMGANEHGVVVGNEAVWTNQPCSDTGLLGMDLVRLGLERGTTAYEALEIIIRLLALYGQGGNCAEHFEFNYHNSFLIADKNEAWVLETAGMYWAADRVRNGSRSISNNLSIRGVGDKYHHGLDGLIKKTTVQTSNFARIFSYSEYMDEPPPGSREARVRQLCRQHERQFTQETAKSILRDHNGGVCMHGQFETRGSQISILSENNCRHYFIKAPFPCQQEYQPMYFV